MKFLDSMFCMIYGAALVAVIFFGYQPPDNTVAACVFIALFVIYCDRAFK